jgi:hypothetical protein
MAEIGISEFTFGYAFLYEQTQANWGNLRAAPVLPSLRQEQAEGWDAQLPLTGTDFYYQFKLSDYLSRGNAKYRIKPNPTRPEDCIYGGPYYRFWLHKRNYNQQHRRLRQHCLANPNTYYVAPEFNSFEQFNSRFLARQITANSRIIPLTACSDISDGDWHCITFELGNPSWIIHSESQRFEKSFTGKQLETLYRQTQRDWHPITLDFAGELFERTRKIARQMFAEEEPFEAQRLRPLLDAPVEQDRRHLLLRTADILSASLGVTMVLVGSVQ